METTGKQGALPGTLNFFRQLISKAIASDPVIFAIPGVDLLRAQGIDLHARMAANPREASILLITPPMTAKLAENAAVAFAQMPRPRAILSVGVEEIPHLPKPDVVTDTNTKAVEEGIARLKQIFTENAWHPEAAPFQEEVINPKEEEEQMHHHNQHQHKMEHDQKDQPGEDHQKHQHQMEHEEHKQEEQHQRHDHGGGGGMMSMEMMTKNLPRSQDGLPMEWNEAHFGPFFPGLPGGLAFHMQLDGDTVAEVHWEKELNYRHPEQSLRCSLQDFPHRFASLSPFSPGTFQILAELALEQLMDKKAAEAVTHARLVVIERERILNHLNWLSLFGTTLGNSWLTQQAHALFFQIQQDTPSLSEHTYQDISGFLKRLKKLPFLSWKMKGIGSIPPVLWHHTSGPVLRATGERQDTRMHDPVYQRLDFTAATVTSNDVWGRFLVRLDEIKESLRLVRNVTQVEMNEKNTFDKNISGKGHAVVETARGKTGLDIGVQEGKIQQVTLEVPSFHHIALLPQVIKGQEIGDALMTIASLDISPWEIKN